MTDKEKLDKIRELIEHTHNRFGYYSSREYLSDTFKQEILDVIEQ